MMGLLGALGGLLGYEAATLKTKIQSQLVLWGVLAALGLVGVVFLLVAANAGLTVLVGPIYAPLIIAGAALLVALVVYLIGGAQRKAKAKEEAEDRRRTEANAMMATAAVSAIPLLLPTLKKVGLPAAGIAAALFIFMQMRGSRDGE